MKTAGQFKALASAMFAVIVMVMAVVLSGCVGDKPNNPVIPPDPPGGGGGSPDIFAVDISKETEWNYLVAAKDGSSMFIDVDESTDMPARVFLKPDKNSNEGSTIFFKENGLPDRMVVNGHILYYGNFNGYKYDLAIIYPDNRIEYHYGIETDVSWDDYVGSSGLGKARSIAGWRDFGNWFKYWGLPAVVTGLTCGSAAVTHNPALWIDCGIGVVSYVGNIAIEVINVACKSCNMDGVRLIADMIGCADFFTGGEWATMLDMLGGIDALNSCVSVVGGMTSILSNQDYNLTQQKITQINEAIRKIDGDVLTEIPRELLDLFLDLGITINSGKNPPNIEGTYLVPTLTLMRNTTVRGVAGQWDKNVTFSGQNYTSLTVNVDYTLPSENGAFSLNGLGYIVGSNNKFTIIVDGIREEEGYTAKTVEAFSGEITATGINNYQWAVFMIDNSGDPLGTWIENGTGYSKRGTAVSFDPNQPGLANNPIPLAADIWKTDSLTSGVLKEKWYSFNVVSGESYRVWWSDSYEGAADHTLDILVSAQYENGTSIFSGVDNAYSTPKTFTANQTGIVKIRVYPYSSGTGTYALTYSVGSTAIRPLAKTKTFSGRPSPVNNVKGVKKASSETVSFGGRH